MKKGVLCAFAALPFCAAAFDIPLDMYPDELDNGAVKHAFTLPELAEGEVRKVALIISQTREADCNTRGLPGSFSQEDLVGWGYPWYEFKPAEHGPTTLMACPEPATERVLEVTSPLYRYNAKLPLVVYAPPGYEVRYQVWGPLED